MRFFFQDFFYIVYISIFLIQLQIFTTKSNRRVYNFPRNGPLKVDTGQFPAKLQTTSSKIVGDTL